MKTLHSLGSTFSQAKNQLIRKFTVALLLILTTFSVSAFAMGRNDAPCKFGDDCAATIYYRICNNWCFWY